MVWRVDDTLVRAASSPVPARGSLVFNAWLELSLGEEQARALEAELLALVDRYAAMTARGEVRSVLLRVALAPTDLVE